MGKIPTDVNKNHFTMLYRNYCYVFIENFSHKLSPCRHCRISLILKLILTKDSAILCETGILRIWDSIIFIFISTISMILILCWMIVPVNILVILPRVIIMCISTSVIP